MKNENIKKINGIGKAMRIILNISKALIIIAAVVTLIITIAAATLPEKALISSGSFTWNIIENDEGLSSIFEGRLVDMENEDESISLPGADVHFKSEVKPSGENVTEYNVTGEYTQDDTRIIKIAVAALCVYIELLCITFLIALIFGARLAKSLEKCESPFEDKVLKAMKAFGFSLIPWAVIKLSAGNASGIAAVLVVLVVMLFYSIFKYGALLQKESDETI